LVGDWEKCYRGTTTGGKKKHENNTYQRGFFGGTYAAWRGWTLRERERETRKKRKNTGHVAADDGRVKPVMLLGQNVLGERKIIIQKWRSRAAANVLEGIRI